MRQVGKYIAEVVESKSIVVVVRLKDYKLVIFNLDARMSDEERSMLKDLSEGFEQYADELYADSDAIEAAEADEVN